MNEPMLKKAMNTLEFLSQDATTREAYEARMKAMRDEVSKLEGAKAEGKAEGKVEGLSEGEQKGKIETALNMLDMGFEVVIIAKATGLSEEEVRSLRPVH